MATPSRTIETINTPDATEFHYGKWPAIVEELIRLGPGKSKRIVPMLEPKEITSLRLAAQALKHRIKLRTVDGASVIRINGPARKR